MVHVLVLDPQPPNLRIGAIATRAGPTSSVGGTRRQQAASARTLGASGQVRRRLGTLQTPAEEHNRARSHTHSSTMLPSLEEGWKPCAARRFEAHECVCLARRHPCMCAALAYPCPAPSRVSAPALSASTELSCPRNRGSPWKPATTATHRLRKPQ